MACNRPNDGTGIRIVRMTGLAPVDLTAHELDRLAGHCRRYTTGRLREIIRCHPVQIVRLDYMNPIGGLGWWMNSIARPSLLDSAAVNRQIRLFDRYVSKAALARSRSGRVERPNLSNTYANGSVIHPAVLCAMAHHMFHSRRETEANRCRPRHRRHCDPPRFEFHSCPIVRQRRHLDRSELRRHDLRAFYRGHVARLRSEI